MVTVPTAHPGCRKYLPVSVRTTPPLVRIGVDGVMLSIEGTGEGHERDAERSERLRVKASAGNVDQVMI
jgi:hypothetical protein